MRSHRKPEQDRDDDVPSPATVVAAVGFGTLPLPFLAVYAVLFVIHGSIKPVNPPDITSSTNGELLAGVVALVAFVVTAVALLWFLNSRRRWPFAVVELVILGVAIESWRHVGPPAPGWLARAYGARATPDRPSGTDPSAPTART